MTRLAVAALATALFAAAAFAQIQPSDRPPGGTRSQTNLLQNRPAPIQIVIENRMGPGIVVFSLFLSPSDDQIWGPDRLGDNVLLPGASIRTPVWGDCTRQDVRIQVMHEDARGRGPTGEIIRHDLDVCAGLRLSPDLAWRVETPT